MQLVENTNTSEIYNQDSGPIGRQPLRAPIFHTLRKSKSNPNNFPRKTQKLRPT